MLHQNLKTKANDYIFIVRRRNLNGVGSDLGVEVTVKRSVVVTVVLMVVYVDGCGGGFSDC